MKILSATLGSMLMIGFVGNFAVTAMTILCQKETCDFSKFTNQPNRKPKNPFPVAANAAITIKDLVGDWGFGSGLMLTYLDHGTGDYSHAGTIYGMKYVIKGDGTFVYKFAARIGPRTIREWGNGVVIIAGSVITFKFEQGPSEKYKFVSLAKSLKRETTLSLIQVNDGVTRRLRCGHDRDYIDCTGSQEWVLRVH